MGWTVSGVGPRMVRVTRTPPGWRRDAVVFLTGQTVSLFGSMIVQYAIMWHLTLVTR